jgi:hypothetical protein
VSNSLENTGNFCDSYLPRGASHTKKPRFLWSFAEIPYSTEQGILKHEQGLFGPEEGIFFEQQGTRFQVHSIGQPKAINVRSHSRYVGDGRSLAHLLCFAAIPDCLAPSKTASYS